MTGIDENYASPGLRWGLLLEDHPGAGYDFALMVGTEIPNGGVPAEYGGDNEFCVATITFPDESKLAPVTAYKPVASEGVADDWNTLCTKTLGRALKKAGYPDNLKDLKALVLWRQRNAEVDAITLAAGEGRAQVAIGSGEQVTAALEAAAVASPEEQTGDDAPEHSEGGPHPETMAQLREAVAELDAETHSRADRWAQDQGYALLEPPTEADAQKVLGKLRATLERNGNGKSAEQKPEPSDDEVVDAEIVEEDSGPVFDPDTGEILDGDEAMIAEVVAGLNDDERKLYDAYLATIGAPSTIGEMTDEHVALVLEWLESGENDGSD